MVPLVTASAVDSSGGVTRLSPALRMRGLDFRHRGHLALLGAGMSVTMCSNSWITVFSCEWARCVAGQCGRWRATLFGGGSLGFDMRLNFAVGIGLMSATTQEQLKELNILQKQLLTGCCEHPRGAESDRDKKSSLLYRGRDLHNLAVLKHYNKPEGSAPATIDQV